MDGWMMVIVIVREDNMTGREKRIIVVSVRVIQGKRFRNGDTGIQSWGVVDVECNRGDARQPSGENDDK